MGRFGLRRERYFFTFDISICLAYIFFIKNNIILHYFKYKFLILLTETTQLKQIF